MLSLPLLAEENKHFFQDGQWSDLLGLWCGCQTEVILLKLLACADNGTGGVFRLGWRIVTWPDRGRFGRDVSKALPASLQCFVAFGMGHVGLEGLRLLLLLLLVLALIGDAFFKPTLVLLPGRCHRFMFRDIEICALTLLARVDGKGMGRVAVHVSGWCALRVSRLLAFCDDQLLRCGVCAPIYGVDFPARLHPG